MGAFRHGYFNMRASRTAAGNTDLSDAIHHTATTQRRSMTGSILGCLRAATRRDGSTVSEEASPMRVLTQAVARILGLVPELGDRPVYNYLLSPYSILSDRRS